MLSYIVDSKRGRTYTPLEKIGCGGFGDVYHARQSASEGELERDVALKVISKSRLEEARYPLERVQNEVQVHYQLSAHPHVVGLLHAFDTIDSFVLVTEYCSGGDLQRSLERRRGKPYSEHEAREVLRQLTDGLAFLHRHCVMHRDLKLANVLLTEDGKCKIADFGLATPYGYGTSPSSSTKNVPPHQTMCGTPSSIAPEMTSGRGYYHEVDLWGLGVILYWLLVGHPPFDSSGSQRATIQNVRTQRPHFPLSLSLNARNLLEGLLEKDPASRLSLDEVRRHPFLVAASSERFVSDSGFATMSESVSRRTPPEIRRPLSETDFLRRKRGGVLGKQLMHHEEDRSPRPRSGSVTALPTASSVPTPKLAARLNTRWLNVFPEQMRNARLKEGVEGRILDDGVQMIFHITKRSGRRVRELVHVSSDGDTVSVEKDEGGERTVYSYVTLPRHYYQKYNLIAGFVHNLRKGTPKVTQHLADGGVCHLMGNEPDPNFQLLMPDCGPKITYSAGRVCYDDGGTREYFSCPLTSELKETRPIFQQFSAYHRRCLKIARDAEGWEGDVDSFPIVIGVKKKSDGNTRMKVARREVTDATKQLARVASSFASASVAPSETYSRLSATSTDQSKTIFQKAFSDNTRVLVQKADHGYVFTYIDDRLGVEQEYRAKDSKPEELRDKFEQAILDLKKKQEAQLQQRSPSWAMRDFYPHR